MTTMSIQDGSGNEIPMTEPPDYINDFITEFEDKLTKKKNEGK